MSSDPCLFLDWDTEFFGRRIARVNGHRLDPQRLRVVLDWCAARRIECLYFLADSNHQETVRLVEMHRFRFVDIRVTLQSKLKQRASPPQQPVEDIMLRHAKLDDIPALQAIARTSYIDSRYYADSCFPRERCEAFYEEWIKNSCEGYADAVLVAEMGQVPIAYVSCHLSQDRIQGQIGIVGVAAQAQGRGIGQMLLNESLRWFSAQGVREVSVVTQGRNVAAQRLYQRSGFVTLSVQLWYHKWFIDCTAEKNDEQVQDSV